MKLYQTVEDRDNPDHIEANAPFICTAANAWLGIGYYFWDTLIDNAHWWGNVRYRNGYVIVEYSCLPFHSEKCFDLHGNMEHLKYFNEIIEYLKTKKLFRPDTTVARVIEFLKAKANMLEKYDSIRAYGFYSKSDKNTILFVSGQRYYLDLTPAVQVCLFTKNSLGLSTGKIIYPDHYDENYLA